MVCWSRYNEWVKVCERRLEECGAGRACENSNKEIKIGEFM